MVEKRRFFAVDKPSLETSIRKQVAVSEGNYNESNSNELFVADDDLYEISAMNVENSESQRQNGDESHENGGNERTNDIRSNVSGRSVSDCSQESASLSQIGYDLFVSQLLSIIGDASTKDLQHLYKKYFNRPNYVHLASTEYFNGIEYEVEQESQKANEISNEINTPKENKAPNEKENNTKDDSIPDKEEIDRLMERMKSQAKADAETKLAASWKRYIGALDVEAWATRPYLRPLTYKQKLEVKRLIPNKIKKSSIVAAKFGDSAIIRLYTAEDAGSREIGRLPEDITRILSPLIDLGLANFEASVIMDTRSRLSIGDPFYVQIKCYLNNYTFADHAMLVGSEDLQDTKRRKTVAPGSFNFTHVSEAEAALNLKQKSISRMFDKLLLQPTNKATQSENSENVIDLDSPSGTPAPDTVNPTEELNLDQLKEFYMANQQSEYLENLPETTTPPSENFKLQLRPYQKHGLSWMLAREKEMDVLERLSTTEGEVLSTQNKQAIRNQDAGVMDPLWSSFRWPKDPSQEVATNDEEFFYANLYNGELLREKPLIKSILKGGVLADEMGLGKTILTLSLVHSVPYDTNVETPVPRSYASKSTLIVVPMSLLSQWKSEFERSNNNSNHRCFVYYGDSAQADLSHLLCNRYENIPIVVLTTYGTVQNEWTRLNKGRDENGKLRKIGLFSVEFFRIVLDEGHTIRNRNTKTAKSIHELDLRRRWVLTGTPVVNRLDDIFSVVKFLRLEPWSNFSYWKTFVTLPFEQKKFNQTLDVVKSILEPIFLRRTKSMKQKKGQPLVDLPEKEVVIEELEFSKREQLFYDFFKSRAHQSFKEGMKSGDLLKKYTQILTHILRLRQVCCHPELVASSSELDDSWQEELSSFEKPAEAERFTSETALKETMYSLYKRVNPDESECSICTQSPISIGELTVTECGHQYCFHCLQEHIEFQTKNGSKPLCPDCRHPISSYRLFKVRKRDVSKKEVRFHTKEVVDDPYGHYNFQLFYHDPDKSSTKINALLNHLRLLKEQCPGEQIVVFSQFSSYLDILENELKTIGEGNEDDFVVYKFDGRLNMVEREKILKKFSGERPADGKITILLLSLKAGGVGLNLTCANRAFMMDPWWSPSIEDQAIDRIHRIGQAQNVKVVRFIVKDSIETKMLKIQERKRMMGEAVEVEEEERRKQRIEEIKLLFAD